MVALGAAAGGFVAGLSGFAFGLVALGVWVWSVGPASAGPLVVFGSLLGQTLSLSTVRGGLHLPRLLPFIAGGLLGVPAGVLLLHHIDPRSFKLTVGLILLLWCPAMLLVGDLP
ncbi:MAG TPA: TSUP family transporter, partial [bacterium]|nr:TSUP family transporter [bacterium]